MTRSVYQELCAQNVAVQLAVDLDAGKLGCDWLIQKRE